MIRGIKQRICTIFADQWVTPHSGVHYLCTWGVHKVFPILRSARGTPQVHKVFPFSPLNAQLVRSSFNQVVGRGSVLGRSCMHKSGIHQPLVSIRYKTNPARGLSYSESVWVIPCDPNLYFWGASKPAAISCLICIVKVLAWWFWIHKCFLSMY